MRSASQNQPAQRTYIAIVAAPGESHVAVRRNEVVGRIHVEPADSRAVSRNPRVRGIGAHQPRFSGRRIGAQISADITCGKIEGAEAGDLHVREVLTDSAAFAEDLFGGRPNSRNLRIEAEILVDAR